MSPCCLKVKIFQLLMFGKQDRKAGDLLQGKGGFGSDMVEPYYA